MRSPGTTSASRIAQIAAVALLIDYVVTVAVQTSAGADALVSAFDALGPYKLEITVAVVVLLAYGNLRGIREAGRAFAVPTYLFIAALGLVIVVGLIRKAGGESARFGRSMSRRRTAGAAEQRRPHRAPLSSSCSGRSPTVARR